MAEKLDKSSFESYINESQKPVLVDFYNDGCIPCRRLSPLLSKAEEKYGEKLKFAKVKIDMNFDLADKLFVEAAPTLIIFKDGKETDRQRGFADLQTLEKFIESNI
ncbi:MAG: thioredoxin family protein [Acutalibacteraceae bacterium]